MAKYVQTEYGPQHPAPEKCRGCGDKVEPPERLQIAPGGARLCERCVKAIQEEKGMTTQRWKLPEQEEKE